MDRNRDDLDAATRALLVASRALVGVAARSLAGVDDVTLPQYRALVVLTRPVSITIGDLATTLDIHRSTATRLCDRLERKGLVVSRLDEPHGARPRRYFKLTKQGLAAVKAHRVEHERLWHGLGRLLRSRKV